jgi:2-oxoglutarate ferredoxin oxidoreductase subunit alpha
MESNQFRSKVDFVVRIGGEGGEGVISCGELFAQAAARTEYHVFTYITYPAEVRGGYSMIQIRIRDWTIYSMGGAADYLVVFDQQALDRSAGYLKPGGCVIYDPDRVTIGDLPEGRLYPVPLDRISAEAAGGKRGKNIVALGVLGHLFGIEREILANLLHDRFGAKGASVMDINLKALAAGYEAGAEAGLECPVRLGTSSPEKARYMMMSGNEAVALGAIASGCRFVAGYPITPATPIFETLTRLMPMIGGRAIQMEDEIASISACIGASFAGEKAMTPTSGPGLQLMGEQLNLASMLELPLVVVNVQRGGPSTGLPTKTEQSDLKFAIYGTAGESPRAILAPSGVEDCFYQTIRAFNIAERYQMPVILLSDQSIGYRKATVQVPDLSHLTTVDASVSCERIVVPDPERIQIADRVEPAREDLEGYMRFRDTADGVSAIARPGTPGGQYLATGLEHTEAGLPDYSPENHARMTRKRFKKLRALSRALEANPPEYYGPEDAKIGIIGWGSTEGAIREARYLAAEKGIAVRHLHPKMVSPLPDRKIEHFLAELKQVLVVEENYTGQFAHFIKGRFGVRPIEVHKCEGVPITPQEILSAVEKVAAIIDEEDIRRIRK